MRYVPILNRIHDYPRVWVRADQVAGLTAAAVVIPQTIAFTAQAGLPVQVGLYTALVPMLAYTFFGSSRSLNVSPPSRISMLVAAVLLFVGSAGDTTVAIVAASPMALLTGVFLLIACILRLGFSPNFISGPLLAGVYPSPAAGHTRIRLTDWWGRLHELLDHQRQHRELHQSRRKHAHL